MRIRILSDLHLEHHDPPEELCASAGGEADAVVLAGDIGRGPEGVRWARRTFPTVPVLFVPGNHAFYDRHLDSTRLAMEQASDRIPDDPGAAADQNGTFVLQQQAVQVGDVRFLGCTFWTGFRLFPGRRLQAIKACRANMDDYQRIHLLRARRRLRPRDTDRYHHSAVAWLRRQLSQETEARATVIVTHHAPTRHSVDPRYAGDLTSAAFVARREPLVRESGAALWVHGHVHASFDYRVGRTRVVSNPRGHGDENPSFRLGYTIEV